MYNKIPWLDTLITNFFERNRKTIFSAITAQGYFAITETSNNAVSRKNCSLQKC